MAFNKFEPHRPDEGHQEYSSPAAARRVRILRWGWLVTAVYTALGFVFLAVFYFRGNPF